MTSPNAAYARPEVAALVGVVPTAPVRLRVWGFEVYDARLWTPVGFRHSQYAQFSFALELQYLRHLEGAAIASRSINEMRRVGSFSDAQAQSWLAAMRELFPNVSAGERITGVNLPGVGAEFWVNGQRVGVVKDEAFARLFFGIWLDERTSEPKMRVQLLKGLQP
ncbi:chalcone isomerase family protein [Limnohabitans sp. yimb22184]|uniref:chalcone isomerase family protein n=1 Tax=Limnohabitans sp. YIMB22184 TaxID=3374104 RepID=UPI003A889529